MVQVLSWMQPRDHRAAARTVPVLGGVAIAVTLLFLPMAESTGPVDTPLIAVATAGCLAAAILCGLAWSFDEANRLAWAAVPVLGVAIIVVVDLATHDASVTAQIFFIFPVLYGASLLPRAGAIVMTTASVVGEAVVVGAQLSPREAVMNTTYLAAALVTVTVLLVRSAERQATLVAELRRHAATDSLTGLVTRRAFDEASSWRCSVPTTMAPRCSCSTSTGSSRSTTGSDTRAATRCWSSSPACWSRPHVAATWCAGSAATRWRC